jgi:CheY-like chemotaxis protein
MKIILFPALFGISSDLLDKEGWECFSDLDDFTLCLQNKTITMAVLPLSFKYKDIKWSDFYGFQLLRTIRYELKQRYPVIIPAFLPKKVLKEISLQAAEVAKILSSPGICYLPYPWDMRLIPKVKEISEDALEDINYTFYNPKGKASEIVHNLKNKLGSTAAGVPARDLYTTLTDVIKYHFQLIENDILPENRSKFQAVLHEMLEDLRADIAGFIRDQKVDSTSNYQNGPVIIDQYTEIIYQLLPVELNDDGVDDPLYLPWQVLYVDDTEFCRVDVTDKFRKRGVVCHTVGSAYEALDFLRQDTRGKIAVVISDIRLYEENGDWQDLQGYDLLNDVHEVHTRPVAYFVLTSKRGTIVNSVKRKEKFPIQWFSKSDVTTSEQAFNIFAKRIKELGGESWFCNKSQPKMSAWTRESYRFARPLSAYYRKHIERSDHVIAATEIDKKATIFTDNILHSRKNEEIEFLPTLKDNTLSDRMIEKFRFQILLGRRIIYSLWLSAFDEESIFYALRPKGEYNKENRDLLFASTMAVSFKNDIPGEKDIVECNLLGCNLLEEEIDFLVKNFRLNPEIRSLKLNMSDLDLVYELLDGFRQQIEQMHIPIPKEINTFLDRYFAGKLINIADIDKALKISAKIAREKVAMTEFRKGLFQKLTGLQSPKIMALFEKHF